MANLPAPPQDARRIAKLARSDRAAAEQALAGLSVEEQVALVCDTAVGGRAELLGMMPAPEQVVPRVPEAEFCFTVKAMGLESAAWILELATAEQIVASLDLDVWSGHSVELANLDLWLDALAATEDEALLRSVHTLDPELIVLYLKGRIDAVLKPNDDEGWQPEEGWQTLDGQFYFTARSEGDDVAAIARILHLLHQRDYWTYFRMLQGVIWELPSENEEWALRWRTARLQDLGFPTWDEAMSLYRFVAPEDRAHVETGVTLADALEWHLPVWIPSLPEGRDSHHLIFRTLAQLDDHDRRAAFYAFVAVANKVAVADRMSLSDVETTPSAIEKTARWTSRGLESVAGETGLSAAEVVRHVALERLFRVGASLEPEAARPPKAPAEDAE